MIAKKDLLGNWLYNARFYTPLQGV